MQALHSNLIRIWMLGVLSLACIARSEITLPRIFSDNMVLQSGKPLKFWGKSDAGALIEISLDGSKFKCKSDANGEWKVKLPAQKTNTKPQDIKFFENSKLSKTIKNILVGEVWIAGGQSNMEFKLKNEANGKNANASANYPLIRVFTQYDRAVALNPQWDSPKDARWQVCSPQTAWRFSAVGFYFARTLYEDLKVPVGIIETPFSGSYMACWLARDDLDGVECFNESLKKFDSENRDYRSSEAMAKYEAELDSYNDKIEEAKAAGLDTKGLKKPVKPPIARGNLMSMPFVHYNAKIAPLSGLGVRGVLWYQGESDAKDGADCFADRFESLITAWRKYFEDPVLPFCYVQLPSIDRDFWVGSRLAQSAAESKMHNVAMAVTIDLGEEKDVHPKEKLEVGTRLGNQALLKFYGRKGIADYPRLKSVKFNDSVATVELDTPSLIRIRGDVRGFEVLVNGSWQIPQIRNAGAKFFLSVPSGNIDSVRYLAKGWAVPYVCIFNSEGLPLPPFEISR